ncbi:MAG: hypothetical protein KAT65_25185 [Methanophagales archaeon]|nr:hypothetical protein [Methanophagales archaeon]
MNTTKKILVALAVMMVAAAMVVPAAMGANVGYSATVRTGHITAICAAPVPDGAFNDVLEGRSYDITPSFALKNTGDWDAIVEAAFDSQSLNGGAHEYGLIGTGDAIGAAVYIPGTAVALEEAALLGGDKTYLTDDVSDTVITDALPDDSVCYNYNAHLDVPDPVVADIYSGNVVLTFSNV